MKCCYCGKTVTEDEAARYAVHIGDMRVATCSTQHQDQARKNPKQCKISSDTAVELIPL